MCDTFQTITRIVLGCMFVSVLAAAQKTESAQAPQMPPALPIFSAADLAGKVPAPKLEDVQSVDAILHAAYDVISGPAGARDWNRFRSLFLPQARFTQVGKGPDGAGFVISWNVDEFIRDAGAVFAKDPFYENAIVNLPQSYGKPALDFLDAPVPLVDRPRRPAARRRRCASSRSGWLSCTRLQRRSAFGQSCRTVATRAVGHRRQYRRAEWPSRCPCSDTVRRAWGCAGSSRGCRAGSTRPERFPGPALRYAAEAVTHVDFVPLAGAP